MKFRTTILLIIFSFTLLLLWDEWIKHNSDIPLDTITTGPTDLTPSIEDDGLAPTDLPTVNKLESNEVAPVEEIIKDENISEVVTLENPRLRLGINTLGGTVEFAELQDQKSEYHPNGKVILFDKSSSSTYLAQSGLIPYGNNRIKLPNHLTEFQIAEKDT